MTDDANIDRVRRRLFEIIDELRTTEDDDFAGKHRLNTEGDALRQELDKLTDAPAARSMLDGWADRSGRKNSHTTDDDAEAAKARISSPGEGGGST